jgi:hypothetical protein
MSATKGIDSPIRHKNDEYITPDWCIRRLLEAYPIPPTVSLCIDPCAAGGQLIRVAKDMQPGVRWWGMDINPNCLPALSAVVGGPPEGMVGDFLSWRRPLAPPNDIWIISNPPYLLAQEFIEQSLAFAARVIFLLRINFLADGRNKRKGFARKTNPGLLVLPNRPSFNGWGGDACEYAWFVYGDPELAGRWIELGQTSEEEIERWNAAARKKYPEDAPKLRKAEKARLATISLFP